jgi:hypothetical protein
MRIDYTVYRPNSKGVYCQENDSLDGVQEIRLLDTLLSIDYFDGEFNHTRNIPLIILESYTIRK